VSAIETNLWTGLGVATAIVVPVLRNLVGRYWPKTQASGVPDWGKKYLVLLFFSLVTALILLAPPRVAGHGGRGMVDGLPAGFAWESAIEKLGTKSLLSA
jgi:hypothetical protein